MINNCDILIKAGILLTQNERRDIIHGAGLAVSGDRIAAVGLWDEVAAAWTAPETIDLSRCLVLPGLVNAHTHASMTLLRGLADDLPLSDWLEKNVWPVEARLDAELVGLGAELACAEMIRTGTTLFADMYFFSRRVAETAQSCGLRAVVGEGVLEFPTPSYKTVDQALALQRDLVDFAADSELITAGVAVHGVYTVSRDTLERTIALAQETDAPWMIHLAENAWETSLCLEKHGRRPLAQLEAAGCLGPRSVLAHCVDLDQDEIERLAASGAAAVHDPKSNMKLGNGFCPAQRLLDAGAVLALGTDGAASNNSLDMFSDMNACALLQKAHLADPTAMKAQDALDAATLGGARALGLDGAGVLKPGSYADLAALDLDRPGLVPSLDPVSLAVYSARGSDVCLTMVAGRILYHAGEFPSLDHAELAVRVRRAVPGILEIRAQARSKIS